MTDIPILHTLGYLLVAAAIAALVSRPLRVPTIVAYIAIGLVLGPATGLVEYTETLEVIAEIGIALLLFLVGLELSLAKIRDVGKVAVVAGVGQVVFTAAGGFGLAMLLGFAVMESIFLATALTFSSTVVVVKLLNEKGDLDSLYGRIAVGIFLVQDLVVIVVLTLLSGLGSPEQMSFGSVAGGIGRAFGGMLLLLGAALMAARYVLPRVFGWIARSPQALLVWGLAWCFGLVMGAEMLHISAEIGAFLAGISLAQLPYADDLRRRVGPLTNFFIAIFFLSLGLRMELGAAVTHWPAAAALSLFVLIGNPFIFMWIISRMKYSERTSFMTSVTVAQISEFSFVFAALGLSSGLIDEGILSLIALVGLVTIATSSYMILYSGPLYRVARRWGLLKLFRAREDSEEDDPDDQPLRGHVIVVGLNPLGLRIIEELTARGESVLAVDADPEACERLDVRSCVGNARHLPVLEVARLEHAKLLVSALRDEETNELLAYHAARAGVPSSLHAFNSDVARDLREAGATHLMHPKDDGVQRMIDLLREHEVIAR